MFKRLLLLLVILSVLAGGLGLWTWNALSQPYRGYTEDEVFVDIPPGSSTAEIAGRLAAAGVVRDPLLFRIAVTLQGADLRLKAGEYRFADDSTAEEVVARIARGDVYAHKLQFAEGLTMREMAAIFGRSGLGTAEEFLLAASDVSAVRDIDSEAKNLEGYLFPSTYMLPRRAGAIGTVQAMVREFRKALAAATPPAGMSVRELVSLASIVEKETAVPDERAMVAAVYANRLRIGMPLQCDPTVIYALILKDRWDGNLTHDNMQVDSPYNTYRYAGLPPGPIASPGRASLKAAARPADVPYLYFVSRNDGTHVFAATLAEHNRNVNQWQKRR
jgi:UPF0755 protein